VFIQHAPDSLYKKMLVGLKVNDILEYGPFAGINSFTDLFI